MATEVNHQELKIIAISRKEATDLIGLLVAQLADVTLVGNQGGAAPTINVVDRGRILYRLVLTLEPEANSLLATLMEPEKS